MAENTEPSFVAVAPGVRIPPEAIREAFVRSGGPGGQNVNKVSTQAQLRVTVAAIECTEEQRDRIRRRAPVTRADEIVVRASAHRSQAQNRAAARERLVAIVRDALHEDAVRVKTRPTRASRERRLHAKSQGAVTKSLRRRPSGED